MALQYSVLVRNARLDAVEAAIGASAVITVRTGAPPANCAAANTGTLLATVNLPSDWMADASGGTKSMLGAWEDGSADAAGIPGHFRIFATDGTTCGAQGTVTETGAGGDLTVNLPFLEIGDAFVFTSFTINAGNT